MTNEFLYKEYELSYEQLRYYDDRHTNMMKYMFTLTSSVATAQFAIYKFTQGFTQGFFAFQAFLSAVVFIATVLLYLAMLRNRLYFVYMVRQINAIRGYFLETEAKQFQYNQLYTSTDFPALKIFSVHTFQMLGASILSSLFAGILAYSISPALDKNSSLLASCIVFAIVVIVEVVGGVVYLSSIKGKSADQAIHGRGIKLEEQKK
jgi:hypothetical protein